MGPTLTPARLDFPCALGLGIFLGFLFTQESYKIVLMLAVKDYFWAGFSSHTESLQEAFQPHVCGFSGGITGEGRCNCQGPREPSLMKSAGCDPVSPQPRKLSSIHSFLWCRPVSTSFFRSVRPIVL